MPIDLSLTGKRWLMREDAPIFAGAHIEQFLLSLMRERGIDPRCEGEVLLPPTIFTGMTKAVEHIREAVANKESIGIFGDYDCDGITATIQLLRYFRRNGIEPSVRLPHRATDGYGLKSHIIDEFLEKKTRLLITVDTGIGSAKEVRRAQKEGMDVIITDHHHPHRNLPPAVAIVHPQLSPEYPLPHPSGAGVVLQLLNALEEGEWEGMHLDRALAMIGTIADVMELKGQNRLIVQQGLEALKELKEEPLASLLIQAGLNKENVTSTDIAFRIAPRINAAGRMTDPLIGLSALLNGGEALITLELLNEQRQKLTENLFKEALAEIEPALDRSFLCIAREDFPEGIVGLIAGKLTEMFGKPSLVGRIKGDKCTASLRSVPAYNISEGLDRCRDLLQYYGGHAQAAGCTFSTELLDELSERLDADVRKYAKEEDLLPTLMIDAELPPEALNLKLCEGLRHLEPFGKGNPEPLFLLKNVQIDYQRCVGSDGAHLQGTISGNKLIGFRLGHLQEQLTGPVDVVCKLGTDSWNGMVRVQLFVEDIGIPKKVALPVIE
ncbi:single-stranded-DNA-specific exonuclease RecJ [Patescibacteria group bacterium]|nr:single-stranded-DNA-specific exonuclease RecJ [Patescibacteria group bacterium]MBU2260172.1 single-stranded-DNA-specific exonuclease RecJ [Patescibacteria group bacterium]